MPIRDNEVIILSKAINSFVVIARSFHSFLLKDRNLFFNSMINDKFTDKVINKKLQAHTLSRCVATLLMINIAVLMKRLRVSLQQYFHFSDTLLSSIRNSM